jgi:hypothetical protein
MPLNAKRSWRRDLINGHFFDSAIGDSGNSQGACRRLSGKAQSVLRSFSSQIRVHLRRHINGECGPLILDAALWRNGYVLAVMFDEGGPPE